MMSRSLTLLALLPLVLALVMIAGGIVLLVLAARSRRLSGAAQSWPSVKARVTGASLQEVSGADASRPVSYLPVVEYDYCVLGADYHGRRVSFEGPYASRQKAEEVLARYPAESTPNVYYNPNNPNEAVLVRDANRPVVMLALGILLLLLGLGICCVGAGLGLFLPALQGPTAP